MTKKILLKRSTPLFILILYGLNMQGQVNITNCLKLKDSVFGKYQSGEYAAKNEVIDIKNGYYALEWNEEDKDGNIIHRIPLFQAAIFKNSDMTTTLGITEHHADMQCTWYESHFYGISQNGDSIAEIEFGSILPNLNWDNFLSESLSKRVLEKYLPELRETYLDADAMVRDVLDEVYDIHYIMPRNGTHVKVELAICDYIRLNEVDIDTQDWEIIEHDFKTLVLKYDRRQRVFRLQ